MRGIRPWFDPWRGRNPVFLRELRQSHSVFAAWLDYARHYRFVIVYWSVLLAALSFVLAFLFYPLLALLQWISTLAAVVAIPPHVARVIARERELGTWDLLCVTPLSRRAIVWGKFLGGLATLPLLELVLLVGLLQAGALVPTLILGQAGLAPSLVRGVSGWTELAWAIPLVALHLLQPLATLVSAGAIALGLATLTRSSRRAVAASYIALALTHLLPLVLGPIAGPRLLGPLPVILEPLVGPLLAPLYALITPLPLWAGIAHLERGG